MKTNTYISLLLGSVLLTVLYWIFDSIFGIEFQIRDFALILFANLLTALVIVLLIKYSVLQGARLMLSVFATYFIIGHFNILIEAYIFNVTDRGETIREIVRGFLVVSIFSPIAVLLFKKKEATSLMHHESRHWLSWSWRVVVGDLLYLFLYGSTGLILVTVYPQILEFYAGKIPPLELTLKTQLFLRGFLFIGIAYLLIRTINLPPFKRACLTGLVFSIFGGIAPLIPSNLLMPGFVRYGHMIEVGISNFIFGLVLTYLLTQKTAKETAPEISLQPS